MTPRRPRTPLGTQPPVSIEPAKQIAGVIEPKPAPNANALAAHEKALAADQEKSIIVHIDDDWLARLDLPLD